MPGDPKNEWIDPDRCKPRYCVWELTLACNQRCGHCGSRAGKARPDELDTAEAQGVVRALAALGCEVITLSGGEPTLRPDWETIASAIREAGMIVNMVTNGYALDRPQAERMKACGLANVAVSIDGPEQIHEHIRGKGSFGRTTRSLGLLREVGLSTTVMTTVNTLNLHRLDEIHALALSAGADRWRCQLGKPMGNMKANAELALKPRDLLVLLPSLHRLNRRGPLRVGIGDSIGYYGPFDSELRSVSWKGKPQMWGGCQAGLQAIGIESDGGVKGCLSMQAFSNGPDPFREGGVRERSLERIWRDPAAFAYNRRFTPEDLTGFCARCQYRLACRGGARCVAAAVSGMLGEDLFCYHRVAALAASWPNRLARHLATAASVVGLMCAGCVDYRSVHPGDDPIDCQVIDCESDGLPPDVFDTCCEPAVDYGVEPPDCSQVCCDCDYGDTPPEILEQCCEPVVTPDYGVMPPDCSLVCCDCDYGALPPGTWEQCCEPAVDYGVEPPDCTDVCCDCDYGQLPPEIIEACCDDDDP